MLTTKQLALKMGGVSTHSVFYAADQFRWKQRDNPYGKGFVWDVTDEHIEEYKRIRAASAVPIERRRAQVADLIDLFDRASKGRTFARRESDIPWREPSYVNIPDDGKDDEPDTKTTQNGQGKGRPRDATYYEVQGTLSELLEDGYYSPKALREKLLEYCPESFSLDDRSFYRYFYEIAERLGVHLIRVRDRKKDVAAYKKLSLEQIGTLRKRGTGDSEIMYRLGLKQKEFLKLLDM